MANSQTRPGKRERLIAGATDLLHQQGVERTTLAQIATTADVPVGNVYYYFKTRDDLLRAVIDFRTGQVEALLGQLDEIPDPGLRLKALLHSWTDRPDDVAAHGCPIGSLCSDLDKIDTDLSRRAATMLARLVEWSGTQLGLLGRADAAELAVTLLAGIQGAALLANAFHDPQVLLREGRRLEEWVDSLTG